MTKRFTVKDDVGMLDVACANIFDNGEFIGTVPLFDAEKFVDLLNKLHEDYQDAITTLLKVKEENEQLKERNERQAKQLDNLYTLIEKQDWKTLKGLIQEFQECEEQLQREWRTCE